VARVAGRFGGVEAGVGEQLRGEGVLLAVAGFGLGFGFVFRGGGSGGGGRGFGERPHQLEMGLGVAVVAVLAHDEGLFGVERHDAGRFGDDAPAALARREGVVGLADAIAVDVAGGEAGRHQRGREHRDVEVASRHDAVGPEPVQEEEMVGAEAVRHSEGEGTGAPRSLDQGGEARWISGARLVEALGEGDGVAVGVEEPSGEAGLAEDAEAPVQGEGEARGGVRGLELPVGDLVPDRGPAGLAQEFDPQPAFGEEPRLLGEGDRGDVDEGDEADAEGAVGALEDSFHASSEKPLLCQPAPLGSKVALNDFIRLMKFAHGEPGRDRVMERLDSRQLRAVPHGKQVNHQRPTPNRAGGGRVRREMGNLVSILLTETSTKTYTPVDVLHRPYL